MGDWKVQGTQENTHIGGKYVIAADGEAPIAYVSGHDKAHLIAATPEMYEALKYILEYYSDSLEYEDKEKWFDLVSKAEGRQELQAVTAQNASQRQLRGKQPFDLNPSTDVR